jgi:hypothetical protein
MKLVRVLVITRASAVLGIGGVAFVTAAPTGGAVAMHPFRLPPV